ncbi:MAG: aminotransferase class I/II-fold pyridoxal phosphate-dependent enzyme [Myxococcales bacterium]|nr:aminotransferase class I/II-fold pyridoxal phosphate-dependent enzyme [Myxococcales bacterium]
MSRRLSTLVIHAGSTHTGGAVVQPIFQSANYLQQDAERYDGVRYLRLANSPQQLALCRKLAAIEQAEDALALASGMAAISTALLSVLKAGDHLLVQRNLYGGTATLLDDLARLGITSTPIDASDPSSWAAAATDHTRAIYVEAISNPLLQVPALQDVVDFAEARGLVSCIDATFVSPTGFQPIPFGFDLVVHSATKYLNGHSDLVAGVIAGSAERIERARSLHNHLGGCLDAHACFLLDRGLKTLTLRVPAQAQRALHLAQVLSEHDAVARVRYPGLPSDPEHARASRWFAHASGMLTFETHTDDAAQRFLQRVSIALNAASLGGLETLVVRPSRSSHLGLEPEQRRALGITDRLIRVSVGAEDPDDLVEDFVSALA